MTVESNNDFAPEVEHALAPEVTVTVPQPREPTALVRDWWARSPVRAVLRFVWGIPQDVAAGESFMRQVLIFTQNITAKLNGHIDRTNKIGDGVNQVGNYAHEIELMVRHLARSDDRLRRSLQAWDENQERKRKLAEAPADAGVVNAAGLTLSAGTESVEQAVEDLQPKIVEIAPIHRIRKPSDN